MSGLGQALAVFGVAFAVFCAFWYACFWLCKVTGFESQVTAQYGFTSGIGPMILTALGMATIISGMWHGLNCHEPGCWRLGRHKVSGTPWCNVHHEKARPELAEAELLARMAAEMTAIRALLEDPPWR